jgi:prepilin-type N-terminal cleavage/methylation domain-containing protein
MIIRVRKTNKGITLIELLAALSVISVISITIYSVLFSGLKTYDRVMAKNELRDEGNYIMTNLIHAFFTLKSSEIKEKRLPQSGTNDYYLVKTDGTNLGIINSKIIINNSQISPTDDKLIITTDSKIEEVAPNLFEVTLVLKKQNSNETLKLSSTLSIVDDIEENKK